MKVISKALAAAVLSVALAMPATALASREVPTRSLTTSRVRMIDRTRNVFRPGTVTIDRGDRVRWVNRGDVAHTATFARWDSGTVPPGGSASHRFRRSGTFRYHCLIHPEMTGTVIVR
jgi:plastocyanin